MIILAIDPGVKACACALVKDSTLVAVWFDTAPLRPASWSDQPDRVVVEMPEYQGARSDAARTEDLIALAWAGAAAAYSVGVPVECVPPSTWIRGESKPPRLCRFWERTLTLAESGLFPANTGDKVNRAAEACALKPGRPGASYYGRWDGHNLLDAAALGLWYVGRR